jgi:hypothetical protein
MHVLRWRPTLNLPARVALAALRAGSYATRQRLYSQQAPHDESTDQPLVGGEDQRDRSSFSNNRYLKPPREVRGRGRRFRQSSSPLATNSLGQQAEVLILSDSRKSDQNPDDGLDRPASLDDTAVESSSDGSIRLETTHFSTDRGSQDESTETLTDSKSIIDVLENEESSALDDGMVAEQIESLQPRSFQGVGPPVISKRAFKRITTSLRKSFTTTQLKTYYSNYLDAAPEVSASPPAIEKFWGEKWDPVAEDAESKHPDGQQPNKNDKSNVIKSIIKSLWKVEVKSDRVEVGSVNGCISEFNFSLLSSGGPVSQ